MHLLGKHLEAGACRQSSRFTRVIPSRSMIAPTWVPPELAAHDTCLGPRLRHLDTPMSTIQFPGRPTCSPISRFRWTPMACLWVTETLSQCRFAADCSEWVAYTPRTAK